MSAVRMTVIKHFSSSIISSFHRQHFIIHRRYKKSNKLCLTYAMDVLEYNCNILHHPDQNSGSGAERELSGLLLGQTAGTGAQLY